MAEPQPTSGPTPIEQAKTAAKAVGDTAQAAGKAVEDVGKTTLKTADRMWHFFDGTIRGALDGSAKFGRIGFWLGIAAGVTAALTVGTVMVGGFAFSGLALPFYGALAGAVAGAGGGLVKGALTGGAERVALETRKEKYASELAERRSARVTPSAKRINRAYDKARDHIDRINYDKIDQYNDRISQQNQGSWVERVEASRDHSGLGR